MEKKRVKKERPFIVSGAAEDIGKFSYRIKTFSSTLAYIKATEKLREENPGKLIKFIEQTRVEKEKTEQQLVLPL